MTIASGASRTTRRYPSATARRPSRLSTLVPREVEAERTDREEQHEGGSQEDDRNGCCVARVAALDLVEDEDRRHFRAEGVVPGDDDDGADLSESARKREDDAGKDPGQEIGKHDPAEDGELAGAERRSEEH